jgi:ureidoacrylate peracid hydrolase
MTTKPGGGGSADLGNEPGPLPPLSEPGRTAVIVVDVQRMFTDLFGLPVSPPLTDVLPTMARVVEAARDAGTTIVFVRSIIKEDEHSRNTLSWPPHIVAGLAPDAEGTDWDPQVVPAAGDIEVIKRRYSAFFGTELDALLRERGIETVVLIGLTTNVCVQSSVRDAWQLDYNTVTLSDCCAEVGQENQESSLAFNARNFGSVQTSDALIAHWQAHAGQGDRVTARVY